MTLHRAPDGCRFSLRFELGGQPHVHVHGCVLHGRGEDIAREFFRKRHMFRTDLVLCIAVRERIGLPGTGCGFDRIAVSGFDEPLDLE